MCDVTPCTTTNPSICEQFVSMKDGRKGELGRKNEKKEEKKEGKKKGKKEGKE